MAFGGPIATLLLVQLFEGSGLAGLALAAVVGTIVTTTGVALFAYGAVRAIEDEGASE